MKPSTLICWLALLPALLGQAQVPSLLNFQGRVSVDGVNFTGSGQFKFALVDGAGATSYWSNDGSSTAGAEPADAVALPVTQGLYSVLLGDATLPHMAALSPSDFAHPDVHLRIWFNDGTNGFQRLEPDQRIGAVGYALMAAGVPAGAIGSAQLAEGAVTGAKLAPGAVDAAALAPDAVLRNLASAGASAVPSGGIVFSETADNPALRAAGYLPAGTVTLGTDAWETRPHSMSPALRSRHTAVWTGSEVIYFGGVLAAQRVGTSGVVGARYQPSRHRWEPLTSLGAPVSRVNHTAIWTGTEMLVWGGAAQGGGVDVRGWRFDPAKGQWRAMSTLGQPEMRYEHVAVWTGKEMIVWGGLAYATSAPVQTGGAYDPATDKWRSLSLENAPAPRSSAGAAWSGTELMVWGGYATRTNEGVITSIVLGDGGRYNPATEAWTPCSGSGAPTPRARLSATWTGNALVLLGGVDGQGNLAGDYALYEPRADRWQTLPAPAALGRRFGHTAVWADDAILVWGGQLQTVSGGAYVPTSTGARFDTASGTWSALPVEQAPPAALRSPGVWTGQQFIVWGGEGSGPNGPVGGVYVPAEQRWMPFYRPSALVEGRLGHTTVWTGKELLVWGGFNGSAALNTGFAYDPVSDTATNLPAPQLSPRGWHSAVWTGTEMLVWGGSLSPSTPWLPRYLDGARYDPARRAWLPMAAPPQGFQARTGCSAVWTGRELVLWGGLNASRQPLSDGLRYLPASNTWVSLPVSGAPEARGWHSTVWTGTEMMVWGGQKGFLGTTSGQLTNLQSGGVFDPARNAWTAWITPENAPPASSSQQAAWIGGELFVWGGITNRMVGTYLTNTVGGGRYALRTGEWQPLSPAGAPNLALWLLTGPYAWGSTHSAWTGTEWIVLGNSGSNTNTARLSGARYAPSTDTWTPLPTANAPAARYGATATWTPHGLFVVGGDYQDTALQLYARSRELYLYQRP